MIAPIPIASGTAPAHDLQAEPLLLPAEVAAPQLRVGILVAADADGGGLCDLTAALTAAGHEVELVGPDLEELPCRNGPCVRAQCTFLTAVAKDYAVLVAADAPQLLDHPSALHLLTRAWRHLILVATWGEGASVLGASGIDTGEQPTPGFLIADDAIALAWRLLHALSQIREAGAATPLPPALASKDPAP